MEKYRKNINRQKKAEILSLQLEDCGLTVYFLQTGVDDNKQGAPN